MFNNQKFTVITFAILLTVALFGQVLINAQNVVVFAKSNAVNDSVWVIMPSPTLRRMQSPTLTRTVTRKPTKTRTRTATRTSRATLTVIPTVTRTGTPPTSTMSATCCYDC